MRRPEPGFRTKDGTLHVFRPEAIYLVHAWPLLEAVRKNPLGGPWRPFEPAFRLIRPPRGPEPRPPRAAPRREEGDRQARLALDLPRRLPLAEQRERAFASFRRHFPREVAASVEPLLSHQWRLLLLCQESPDAVELLASNRPLAFCLAAHDELGLRRRRSLSAAACLLGHSQRDLLAWIGLPSSRAAGRALAKLRETSLSLPVLQDLEACLTHPPALRRMAHLPALSAGVVAILADRRIRELATASLLGEVLADPREDAHPHTADQLRDLHRLAGELGRDVSRRRFRSRERAREERDALGLALRDAHARGDPARPFGPPPVPGTTRIVPLRTYGELVEEGREQDNCVATYAGRVTRGETYIYRVLAPERATLSVVRGPGGSWIRGELYAARNEPVDAGVERAIDAWLDAHAL